MSLTRSPRRGRRGLAVGLTVTALLLVSGSTVLAADAGTAGSSDPGLATGGHVSEEAVTADLRAQLDDLRLRFDELSADNTSLQRAVDDLSAERDQMARTLSHFDDTYEPMEADRQLLFELRKDLPETRPEAEAQLERMRSLALAADPAHLGQLVDRLEEAAPAFLDWRFSDHDLGCGGGADLRGQRSQRLRHDHDRVPQRGAPVRGQSTGRDPDRHRPGALRHPTRPFPATLMPSHRSAGQGDS